MYMEEKQKLNYTAPEMEAVDLVYEGVICSSGENLEPQQGQW